MNEHSLDDLYILARKEEARGNDEKYLDLLTELAMKGHSKSQTELGWLLTAGLYSQHQNIDEALKWHLKAISSGSPENYFCLGMLYMPKFDGANKTFSSNEIKSREYFNLAIQGFKGKAKNGDTRAAYRLSEMYSMGLGVDEDQEEAGFWLDKYNKLKQKSKGQIEPPP